MKTRFYILFVIALGLQITIFNGLGFYISYVPYIGLWGVVFYPLRSNEILYLLVAFLTGLILGSSMGAGGLFAAVAVSFAFIRRWIIKLLFPDWAEKNLSFPRFSFLQLTVYLLVSSFILTFFIYLFDMVPLNHGMEQLKDFVAHALLSAFFLGIYTLLFYWENQYKAH